MRLSTIVVLGLLLAGCTAAPPTSRVAGASPTPAAGGPIPAPGATESSGTTDLHAFPTLEELLPSEVGGETLDKISLAAVSERQDEKTREVLRRLDRTVADVQLAAATTNNANVQIGAFRVVGSDAAQLVATFQAVEEEQASNQAVYGVASIGGKRLLTRTFDTQLTYLYPAQDIMFILSGDPVLVEEALAKLP